jgi:hypothetical protein
LFSLLGLLEDGVGPDTIGDMTTNAILPAITALTEESAKALGLKTSKQPIGEVTASLPVNPFSGVPILLISLDMLRDLPVASDWSDVSFAAAENEEIRQRVNRYIGEIWKQSLREQKSAIRSHALASKEAFKAILDAVYLLDNDHYDYSEDLEGHRIFREGISTLAQQFPLKLEKPAKYTQAELRATVQEIINHFRILIEDNGLNYLLWHNSKPRKERAAQKLFFGIADAYCKSNNVDISPETDSGGGPVDFKFSAGYAARILVEIKLSTGQVVHGFEKQLEVYEKASKSFASILLVIDVGKMGDKLERIIALSNRRAARGKQSPEIEVVDATLKPSASKR